MSGNPQKASAGDMLHFLMFLGAACVLWYYALTMQWPWFFIVGAMVAWLMLLVGTSDWVDVIYPAIMLIVLHVVFSVAYGGYWIYAANNEARTVAVVVCKHFTTDNTASSNTETRIRTTHGDFTLGALKFIDATGKVTYYSSGADAATRFPLGGSFRVTHKGGHWGASDVVKEATQLSQSVGACKK